MSAQDLRVARFNDMLANWQEMATADLRVEIRGIVTVHFILSELDSPGDPATRIARFQGLLAHYDGLGDLELREAVGGLLAAHVELRDRIVTERQGDPFLFGLWSMQNVTNGLCDAAIATQEGAPDAAERLEAQKLRWLRIPPIGI